MDDAFGVRGVQRIGNLNRQVQHFVGLERFPGKALLQGLSLQILHGDEGLAFVLVDIVNDADVGMIERGGSPGFPLESFQGLPVLREFFGQEFEGDGALSLVSSALYTTPMPPPPSFSSMR